MAISTARKLHMALANNNLSSFFISTTNFLYYLHSKRIRESTVKRRFLLFFTLSMLLVIKIHNVAPSVSLSKRLEIAQQGYITVNGYWRYWIDSETSWPAALATVVIYDQESGGILAPIDVVYTDANGYFESNSIPNNDGPGEDGLDIVVRVLSASPAAEVVDPNISWYYYTQTEVFPDRSDGPLYIGVRDTSWDDRGAWWIFSAHFGLTSGYLYLWSEVSYDTPTVTCFWPYGTWPQYVWPSQEIHLPDWACWWNDIILHEYGHHVMYSLYGYIPPSMEEHSINLRSNSTTAWTEGWANFFPLVVFNDPVLEDPWSSTNLETPHWCSAGWDDGDEVEGRVAGALWDIFDSQNDRDPWYYDSFSDGFQRIWNIMQTTSCDTFHEFWQAWNTSGYPKQPALMAIFQNSIDYRGPGDVNGDCSVDMTDISLAIDAFMTEKGDDEWDQRCDMNYDDWIDMVDISFIIDYYMTTYDC
jgi:hypothetical protein